ncbi:MAG: hypothetical protein KJ645_11985 [Planctomycetes bacterium]|nr:hypothetical protein [Planctomycetota bacterium]
MVLRFFLFSVAIFLVLLVPWNGLAPLEGHGLSHYYKQVIARGASIFISFAFDGENKAVLYDAKDEYFQADYKRLPPGGKAAFPGFNGESVHYNFLMLLALILASPRLGWKQRFMRAGIGLFILYLLHAFQVAVKIESAFATLAGDYSQTYYSDLHRNILEIITQFFEVFGQQLLPFALWALLCVPAILKKD